MGPTIALQRFVVVKVLLLSAGRDDLVERRHRDVDMPLVDQLRHKAVEQRQQQCADVRAVDVGIGHDDDLVVAQLGDVEVIAVAL